MRAGAARRVIGHARTRDTEREYDLLLPSPQIVAPAANSFSECELANRTWRGPAQLS
jgi:hypothetical protein